jgi:hypothetical protein
MRYYIINPDPDPLANYGVDGQGGDKETSPYGISSLHEEAVGLISAAVVVGEPKFLMGSTWYSTVPRHL